MPAKKPTSKTSEPLNKLPAAPKRLDNEAKAYWKEIGTELINIRALTPLHLRTLEVLCRWYSEYIELDRWCVDNPELAVFTTDKGYVGEHPKVRHRQNAFANLVKLWAKFGLTPTALQTLGKHGGGAAPANAVLSFAAEKLDDDY